MLLCRDLIPRLILVLMVLGALAPAEAAEVQRRMLQNAFEGNEPTQADQAVARETLRQLHDSDSEYDDPEFTQLLRRIGRGERPDPHERSTAYRWINNYERNSASNGAGPGNAGPDAGRPANAPRPIASGTRSGGGAFGSGNLREYGVLVLLSAAVFLVMLGVWYLSRLRRGRHWQTA
jgi:hypothetical protein